MTDGSDGNVTRRWVYWHELCQWKRTTTLSLSWQEVAMSLSGMDREPALWWAMLMLPCDFPNSQCRTCFSRHGAFVLIIVVMVLCITLSQSSVMSHAWAWKTVRWLIDWSFLRHHYHQNCLDEKNPTALLFLNEDALRRCMETFAELALSLVLNIRRWMVG